MNSDGANTPPDPPIPIDKLVAAIFPNASSSTNHARSLRRWPCT